MKIKFASSSTWHDKFLVPIAKELDKLGYITEQIRGSHWEIDSPDDYVILSYHADVNKVKNCKYKLFIEHAISPIKSCYAHLPIGNVDYALVQGEVFSKWLTFCHPNVKQIKCGWHRIEKLYNMKNSRELLIKEHNLNSKKPIIVYCPTWDNVSHPILCGTMEKAYPILNTLGLDNLLVLPHPSCQYGNFYKNEKNVFRNVDIYKYLAGCDLVIGDTSSVLIESTVKNKPIIQLNKWNSLEPFRTWYYNSKKVEPYKELFGILQLGQIVKLNKKEILFAIDFALSNPDFFKSNREHWKAISLYNLGNSLKTTVDGIVKVIKRYNG